MIKLIILIMVLCLIMLPFESYSSEEVLGSTLLRDCTSAIKVYDNKDKIDNLDYVQGMSCYSYLSGADDMHTLYTLLLSDFSTDQKILNEHSLYCIPKGFTLNQGSRLIVKFLTENPKDLHFPGVVIITKVFKQSFPCQKNENQPSSGSPVKSQDMFNKGM